MAQIHAGDVGTALVVAVVDESGVVVDLSTATTLTIFLKPPGGAALVTKTAVIDTHGTNGNGTDGLMAYTTVAGDLALPGPWQIQGYVEVGSGKWYTEESGFTIYSNLS